MYLSTALRLKLSLFRKPRLSPALIWLPVGFLPSPTSSGLNWPTLTSDPWCPVKAFFRRSPDIFSISVKPQRRWNGGVVNITFVVSLWTVATPPPLPIPKRYSNLIKTTNMAVGWEPRTCCGDGRRAVASRLPVNYVRNIPAKSPRRSAREKRGTTF